MARHSPSHVLLILTLVALLLPLTSSPTLQAEQAFPGVQVPLSIQSSPISVAVLAQDTNIRINEVMPKPEVGDFEWVELYRPNIFLVYFPLGSQECRWLYDRCSPSRLHAGPMSSTQWSV